jgi:hypothetical protein
LDCDITPCNGETLSYKYGKMQDSNQQPCGYQ